jgi:hypothetical protein
VSFSLVRTPACQKHNPESAKNVTTFIWDIPNFIRVGAGDGQRMAPLSEFTDEQLKSIAQKWTTALLNRAYEQRKERSA